MFDLVAAQSPSYRGRGIARYSTDFVRAMAEHRPDLLAGVVLHPELPMPEDLGDLSEWVTTAPDWEDASVLHLSSAFEPEVPVRTFWPREAAAHGLLTAVTLYDLIPELFPGWYLEDPGLRRRWRCCREVVRLADRVFTLSESARRDAIGVLGLPPTRVTVVGSAPAAVFRRAGSAKDAFKTALACVEDLEEGFVVYNGAFNPRKNVDGLVRAYASLPRQLVERHQLVIVGDAPPLTRNHYLVMAKELGIDGRLLIPGFVPEEVLVSLYQCAALSVYPSLYEGLGLPLIESMACGAPTIGGDNSSLVEILPRDARFEAEDPGAIAEAMTRGLTDEAFRGRLAALAARQPPTWGEVADRGAVVFDEMLAQAPRRPPRWRKRAQLAVVGLPQDVVRALGHLASCDSFAAPEGEEAGDREPGYGQASDRNAGDREPGSGEPGSGEGALPWRALGELDPWRGGYDGVVLWTEALATTGVKAVEKAVMDRQFRVIAVSVGAPDGKKQAKLSAKLSKLERVESLALDASATAGDIARLVFDALKLGSPGSVTRAGPK